MKRLMTAAFAIGLLSATSVLAQPPGEPHAERGGEPGGEHPGGGHPGGGPRPAEPAPRGPAQAGPGGSRGGPGPERGGQTPQPAGPARGDRGGFQPNPGGQRSGGFQPNGPGGQHPGGQHPGGGRPGGDAGFQGGGARGAPGNYHPRFGAPGFRPGPGAARPHYDARFFPRVFQPDRRYAWRGGAWSPPPGYYYRRWGYGDRLPFGWFGARWFINDYYYYDLAVPPYGYEWVRVGPDALLIELDDGQVVESVYGLFY